MLVLRRYVVFIFYYMRNIVIGTARRLWK
jgi:hypothetical protein